MNYKDITVGIVSFKSEKVIFRCLKSIKKIKNIIIFDNSNDVALKNQISKKYPNIQFILSKKNLGYGAGNNQIIKICKTKFVFVINPDTILNNKCEKELLKSINKKNLDFSIIAPLCNQINYGSNFKKIKSIDENLLKVDHVKGFAMLMNIKKIKKIKMFDKNFFLYLEEIDLCKRLIDKNENIYINKNARVKHLGAKSSNIGFEFEKCRNWHWMWSSIYFNKKHYGLLMSSYIFFFKLFNNLIKLIFYLIIINKRKSIIYYFRLSGLVNAFIGNKSTYRPNF